MATSTTHNQRGDRMTSEHALRQRRSRIFDYPDEKQDQADRSNYSL